MNRARGLRRLVGTGYVPYCCRRLLARDGTRRRMFRVEERHGKWNCDPDLLRCPPRAGHRAPRRDVWRWPNRGFAGVADLLRQRLVGQRSSQFGQQRGASKVTDAQAVYTGTTAQCLQQITFADAAVADQDEVAFAADEVAGGQFLDLRPMDGTLEVPVELLQQTGFAKTRLVDTRRSMDRSCLSLARPPSRRWADSRCDQPSGSAWVSRASRVWPTGAIFRLFRWFSSRRRRSGVGVVGRGGGVGSIGVGGRGWRRGFDMG